MKQMIVVLIGVATLPLLLVSTEPSYSAPGNPNLASPTAPAQLQNDMRWLGVESCRPCHKEGGDEAPKKHDRIQLTEYTIWSTKDKHSQAFAVLDNDRSKRMGEMLGLDPKTDPACLSCHSLSHPTIPTSDDAKMDEVSCEACHGPASGYGLEHTVSDWQSRGWDEREALGMKNVFDAVGRAKQCASCHVGNVAEGKVLLHSFYAAGHPPLPGLEIDTFSQAMPRHWNPRSVEHRGQLIFVGALATLAESMTFVADSVAAGSWPDYASFDCASCHHDLRIDSWRRARGYAGGVPGRPQPRTWVNPIASVAAELLGGRAPQRLATMQKNLREALDLRPFGEPQAVRTAAQGFAEWAHGAARELAGREIEPLMEQGLAALCNLEDADRLDFDSARQVAWAIDSLVKLLDVSQKRGEIDAVLKQLAGTLRLELPAGRDVSILDRLPGNLNAISLYEDAVDGEAGSARFAKQLQRLAELLD